MVCTFSFTKWPMSVPDRHRTCEEVEFARGRIDLGGDLGVGERVGHLIGFAELAFDLDEERESRRPPK